MPLKKDKKRGFLPGKKRQEDLLKNPMEEYNRLSSVLAHTNINDKERTMLDMIGNRRNEDDVKDIFAKEQLQKEKMQEDMVGLTCEADSYMSNLISTASKSGMPVVDFRTCSSLVEVIELLKDTIVELGPLRALVNFSPSLFQAALMMLPNSVSKLASSVLGLFPTIVSDTVSSYFDALKDGEEDAGRIAGYRFAVGLCVLILAIDLMTYGEKYVSLITAMVTVLWGINLSVGNWLKAINVKLSPRNVKP